MDWAGAIIEAGTHVARNIYQWSVEAIHGASDPDDQLYKRTSGAATSTGNAADAFDYMQGTFWGVQAATNNMGQRIPRTFEEWLGAIAVATWEGAVNLGHAIYHYIFGPTINALSDAAKATFRTLAGAASASISALLTFIQGPAAWIRDNVAEPIYEASAEHVYGTSSPAKQLSKRTGANSAGAVAGFTDYVWGAVLGTKEIGTKRAPRYVEEWAEWVVGRISETAWEGLTNLGKAVYHFLFGNTISTISDAAQGVFRTLAGATSAAVQSLLDFIGNTSQWVIDNVAKPVFDLAVVHIHREAAAPAPLYPRPANIKTDDPAGNPTIGDYFYGSMLGVRASPKTGQEAKKFPRTITEWLEDLGTAVWSAISNLATATAKHIYEWSLTKVHVASNPRAALYQRTNRTTSSTSVADASTYLWGAVFGVKTVQTRRVPRYVDEWLGSLSEAIWSGLANLATATAKHIYEWSADKVHSTANPTNTLYQRLTRTTSSSTAANAATYIWGAIFGVQNVQSRRVPRYVDEWLASLAETVWGGITNLATSVAKGVYKWALQGAHGVSAADSALALKKRPSSPYDSGGNPTKPTADATLDDYYAGALLGVVKYTPSTISATNPELSFPKSHGEWFVAGLTLSLIHI